LENRENDERRSCGGIRPLALQSTRKESSLTSAASNMDMFIKRSRASRVEFREESNEHATSWLAASVPRVTIEDEKRKLALVVDVARAVWDSA
jgi:hypothetical protein